MLATNKGDVIDPLKNGVVSKSGSKRRVSQGAVTRNHNPRQTSAESAESVNARYADFVRGLQILIKREPVGTHSVHTEPEFINGVWAKSMNFTNGNVLIPRI